LPPKQTAEAVQREIAAWADLGVDAHFSGRDPWYAYHELVREPLARVVGAHPDEVVAMNSLTVNLHLMMVSFYRPTARRRKILMEQAAFPSDVYAARSQLAYHGFDPDEDLLEVRGPGDRPTTDSAAWEALLAARGEEIALVLLGSVNYFTGQLFDVQRITAAARAQGCAVGLDLAHAAGNVPLRLHECDADFAVWCSYKYLNAGPGGVAGCFVHRRHGSGGPPRLAGWWGNDPARRFRMHLEREFVPRPGADGWQLSNPPILALAPLRCSLALFDEAGMGALRDKSRRLTAYLQAWIDHAGAGRLETLTPRDAEARGCQISVRTAGAERLHAELLAAGVVGDFRPPDVLRFAPVPLYNSFHDVWRFGRALSRALQSPR
jgi:kynureninase